jgi:hypothetical protein
MIALSGLGEKPAQKFLFKLLLSTGGCALDTGNLKDVPA